METEERKKLLDGLYTVKVWNSAIEAAAKACWELRQEYSGRHDMWKLALLEAEARIRELEKGSDETPTG